MTRRYRLADATGPTLEVWADCCTSGNCIVCLDLPYGRKRRRLAMRTRDPKLARRTLAGWKDYHPRLVEGQHDQEPPASAPGEPREATERGE